MTPQPYLAQPPRIAAWLVSLFIVSGEAEAILGDMVEEFSHIASKSGAVFAQRWYWRQALKTIVHLVYAAYRSAPWSTTAAVAGGFLLRRLVSRLPEPAIFAFVDRYQIFEHHFQAYLFFISPGIDIGHVLVSLFVGSVVALGAKRREMATTMTLDLIFGSMAVAGSVVTVSRTADYAFLWRLAWYFADSIALVIGGAIVRTRRMAAVPITRMNGANPG